MPIINKLHELYEGLGFSVSSGLSPSHLDGCIEAPFTWLLKDGESFTNGLGISMKEVYFLECLFDGWRPKTGFLIGNSFGWSALAVGLLNPKARIVAIDAGFDANSLTGLEMTNTLARQEGLNLTAVQAVSPEGAAGVMAEQFDGPIEFCFIDGLHTNEQVVKDFKAVQPHLAKDALVLFHDVVMWNMNPGMAEIARIAGAAPELLYGTCSGMAALYFGDDPAVRRTLATFHGNARAREIMQAMPHQRRFRHFYRWKRSFNKRFGRDKVRSA
ncbi:MAG: class I SAM-dependent methyltransferase [Alphaproteobacteria bacterium]